jgi:lipoprotein-anchoring transpeptidase ErfK/SrfK
MEKSKLPALSYTSVLELLAERFHASPKLLQRLNPDGKFERGEVVLVPNVEAFRAPSLKGSTPTSDVAPASGTPTKNADATRANQAKPATAPGATSNVVTVTDQTKTLTVENANGEVVFYAPVTVGSKNDPLPVGEWKVNGVSLEPPFNYNPDLFWDADPSHAKAKIPPGPNNPVGVVWIDLSKEHYGIHGTPEPSRIGYTESHGCIRLTNWDAMRLAALVAPGTKVVLR